VSAPIPSTQGYSAEAPDLLKRYESMTFEDSHRGVSDLIPPAPLDVLDIGAGTGRDAAWFAARGDRVTAIEPTREMREGAIALHGETGVSWIDDNLPELMSVRGRRFDLVWMSAVWMHFLADEREAMLPTIAALMKPGGGLMISLRQGTPHPSRRMFVVSAAETIAHAERAGLRCVRAIEMDSVWQAGVHWSRLWFERPAA
jgi:2-polyprenyl-3-methyl-5-hydroxy-6-metoxy-1,4-benzoquinol methylase